MSRGDYVSELKTARSQRRKLITMQEKLCVMSGEWEGLSGAQETETERLTEAVSEQIRRIDDDIAYWRSGGSNEDLG
ncbi:hypothetical protein ACJ2_44140 [Pantoea sp. QMID2]|nr:hypothetical protein ACJ1_42870 [Pantoea sp. QMID1]GME47765.1 hypothetical protein ACJ3_44000 [Pantoea sp. QMID3]GME62502.1 hypothetical protein ACJ4_43470 [Pantoea sp. QMID4]GME63873.1 hypothetical protein ACJ2_44140 [Pantoea sp. QMID2]